MSSSSNSSPKLLLQKGLFLDTALIHQKVLVLGHRDKIISRFRFSSWPEFPQP